MKYLMQQAYGRDYFAMLDIAEPQHAAACQKHGIEYRVHREFFNAAPYSDSSQAQMYVINQIINGKFADGDIVSMMDVDALWSDTEVNICSALPDGFDLAIKGYGKGFVNSGFVVQRVSKALMNFWRDVISLGPINENNLAIDPRITAILSQHYPLKVHSLSDRWNWFDQNWHMTLATDCPRSEAVILHWQSMAKNRVVDVMKQEMAVA